MDAYDAGEDWRNGGFGLYVHWPFCQAKCPYCDFNSHVAGRIDQDRWRDAYVSEIERVASETPGRVLNSVFFGGGTPSLMAPETVAAVMEAVGRAWPLANDIEVTLEANPTSVEASRFRAFRGAGVNRVSLGVQALNDVDLRRLGRLHSAEDAVAAFDIARSAFDRVSLDLIYARQHQSLEAWRAELRDALAMRPDHLSLYQLTIEPGTAFGARHAAGRLGGLPEDDMAADMYDLTQDLCDAAGLPAYEVSNHAQPGAESRHNMIYWRYGDYAGIGPGAHGRLTGAHTRVATETLPAPTSWLDQVERSGSGAGSRTGLNGPDQAAEYLMMSLRLSEGACLNRLESLSGTQVDVNKINALKDLGMLDMVDNRMIATRRGRIVLNAVLRELLAD